jgi:Thiamine pyrophosphate enzyme, C-terminal TPP binding domain/Diacylglycerol kinase catalytic domain
MLAGTAMNQPARQLSRYGWQPADPPGRPVLFINPRSGDGKAARTGLAERAREAGIESVILAPGQDLAALARDAVTGGADALGMAGGDGSLAVVAAVAAAGGIPFVCIPAGTRNHFALDVGVDRHDVTGALDAFTGGVERRIDTAEVNGRMFLNTVSLGIYGDAVRSPGAWLALTRRAALQPGETVLVLGGTGASGRIAVALAERLGAGRVIAAGRNRAVLDQLPAAATVTLGGADDAAALAEAAGPAGIARTCTREPGLAMLLGELLTLRQMRLPVKIVVFSNGALSFVELEMKAAGIVTYATSLDNPDFAGIARAAGLSGTRVEKASELDDALRAAFDCDGPALVDVATARQELSLPPKLTYGQIKGFTLYATRTILSGEGSELVELTKTNLRQLDTE